MTQDNLDEFVLPDIEEDYLPSGETHEETMPEENPLTALEALEAMNKNSLLEDGDVFTAIETNGDYIDDEEDLLKRFNIDEIISLAIDMGASDIHINPGKQIRYRINGNLIRITHFPIPPGEVTRRLQQKIVTNVAEQSFLENWELDTSYTVKTGLHQGRRVRLSVAKTFEDVMLVMRIIPDTIPQPKELAIEPELLEWTTLNRGLLLMNGPTGTGKSTTLASLMQKMQMERDGVIITVERPVEYIYRDNGKAMVYQREVGRDTLSFSSALDSAMRQDPDIILIGEVRNQEELSGLLYAADTGHLALSTTHANSAAETLNRIKGMYSNAEQAKVLSGLAVVAKGFASQVLCKTPDGKSRFAVREILKVDENIAEMIAQGNSKAIQNYQEQRKITLNHKLLQAAEQGKCTLREALRVSPDTRRLHELINDRKRSL